jgi:hypothetical protein
MDHLHKKPLDPTINAEKQWAREYLLFYHPYYGNWQHPELELLCNLLYFVER